MAPRAMSSRGRLFIVPLVVLSVVLVALVVAIVVVVLARSGGESSEGPAGGIDPCVVGTWRVAEHREEVTMPRFGKVTFTFTFTGTGTGTGAGAGATVRLDANGVGVTDYGTATRFAGTAAGYAIGLDVTGTVTYEYAAAAGTVTFHHPVSSAKGTVYLDGSKSAEVPFTASTDPASYECSGDRMTFKTGLYETTLTHVAG